MVVFRLKMHQKNIFYFKKIIYNINTSKWYENNKKILIWSKEKIKKIIFF